MHLEMEYYLPPECHRTGKRRACNRHRDTFTLDSIISKADLDLRAMHVNSVVRRNALPIEESQLSKR